MSHPIKFGTFAFAEDSEKPASEIDFRYFVQRVADVFDHMGDGMALTDARSRILWVNNTWSEISGYSREEALGNTPGMLRSNLMKPEFYQSMWQALNDSGDWQGVVYNRHKNGTLYRQLMYISEIRDGAGHKTCYLGVMTSYSRLKQREEERSLTHYDPLTGLPNRTLFTSILEHTLQAAAHKRQRIALLCIDLKNFKKKNIKLGYQVADEILKTYAFRLCQWSDGKYLVARVGGDKFTVLVQTAETINEITGVISQILDRLSTPVELSSGEAIDCGGRIGICVYPDTGKTATEMLHHATLALDQAKAKDDLFQFYSSQIGVMVNRRLEVEHALRSALLNKEISLHYQPQIDITNNSVCGVEALMRWHSQTLGAVSPVDFIPLAEEIGLIDSLGKWAIFEACRQMKIWSDEGFQITMAVNVSAKQIAEHGKNLADLIDAALTMYRLPGELLEIEMTESVFLENEEQLAELHQSLSELGVRLALDDFGTGYSSLGYLSSPVFHKLKIDRMFIRDIITNTNNAKITDAVLGLVRKLKMKTLAEGVEDASQLDFLRAHGCQIIQGYYFSRPLDAEGCGAFLRNARKNGVAPAPV
ncbi:MAG: EAL domain-containing protein [Zoogloeaceae bacterium]|jgi:diguanylate cyclase (GGDEF)-like protein/PAS domain S-box-containing protein|nr:EAL domain-containing protein [Zoogloeaceae bacterium]